MNGFDIEDQHKLQSGAFVKKKLASWDSKSKSNMTFPTGSPKKLHYSVKNVSNIVSNESTTFTKKIFTR